MGSMEDGLLDSDRHGFLTCSNFCTVARHSSSRHTAAVHQEETLSQRRWTSAAADDEARCRVNLILLPVTTLSEYIKECVHTPHVLQLWYLCTNTKVITVAVKSCIFEIAFSCQTCYDERFMYT